MSLLGLLGENMTEKKKLLMKDKLVKRPTQWLRELPAGEYTMEQLEKATGRVTSTIKYRLNFLEIPRSYKNINGYPSVIYTWDGIVEYERKNLEKRNKNGEENSKVE